ncbi:MAG: LCP family protein [Peptoniphilaceae bacterium]|nr:LCP family protein [Peptoniphilaceae bacterium]MDY6019097.1 LCP family protein [Anaerococcus sp.]
MRKGLKKLLKVLIIILLIITAFTAIRLIFAIINSSTNSDDFYDNTQFSQPNQDQLFFLFTGLDAEGEDTGSRTDTLMLVLCKKSSKEIKIISIPRDTRVYVNGNLDKINSAHSYGGMPLTIKTLRDFFGIDLNNYLQVSFQGVVDGVDALGGVEVDVDQRVADAMKMNPGPHVFDGEKALWYVRFRKGYNDADLGRIKTQQDFVISFVKQALKPKNLLKLPKLYSAMSKNMKTNIPFSTLASFAWTFKSISNADIATYTVEGSPEIIDGISYLIPNNQSVEDLRNEILYDYLTQ